MLKEANEDHQLESLLARIKEKDEDSLERLYDLTSARIFGLVLAMVRDRDKAGDITLEVFTKIWTHAEQFNPGIGSVRAWLAVLSRNSCLDHLRKSTRRTRIYEGFLRESDAVRLMEETPESELILNQRANQIHTAMKALNGEQKTVILAAYFDDLSHSQIATRLNKPLGTVKSLIRKALVILRHQLSQGERS